MISASRVGNYTAMLQKSTQELARRQGDESDCPRDSTAFQGEITDFIAVGDTLMEKAEKYREATIDSLEEGTQKYESRIYALGDRVKEHVEAVGYKTSCRINEARAQCQKTYVSRLPGSRCAWWRGATQPAWPRYSLSEFRSS